MKIRWQKTLQSAVANNDLPLPWVRGENRRNARAARQAPPAKPLPSKRVVLRIRHRQMA